MSITCALLGSRRPTLSQLLGFRGFLFEKEQEKAVGWARFEPTQEKLVIFQVTRQALRC